MAGELTDAGRVGAHDDFGTDSERKEINRSSGQVSPNATYTPAFQSLLLIS